jgi:hypothetical protein
MANTPGDRRTGEDHAPRTGRVRQPGAHDQLRPAARNRDQAGRWSSRRSARNVGQPRRVGRTRVGDRRVDRRATPARLLASARRTSTAGTAVRPGRHRCPTKRASAHGGPADPRHDHMRARLRRLEPGPGGRASPCGAGSMGPTDLGGGRGRKSGRPTTTAAIRHDRGVRRCGQQRAPASPRRATQRARAGQSRGSRPPGAPSGVGATPRIGARPAPARGRRPAAEPTRSAVQVGAVLGGRTTAAGPGLLAGPAAEGAHGHTHDAGARCGCAVRPRGGRRGLSGRLRGGRRTRVGRALHGSGKCLERYSEPSAVDCDRLVACHYA